MNKRTVLAGHTPPTPLVSLAGTQVLVMDFSNTLMLLKGALRAAWSLVFISLTYPQHLQRFGMELAPAQIAMLT